MDDTKPRPLARGGLKRLSYLRYCLGLTIQELSERFELPQSTVVQYLRRLQERPERKGLSRGE